MKALASFLLLAVATAALLAATDSPVALCSTDTECAELCPETDLACDGGPGGEK